jgi:hypothetical protein
MLLLVATTGITVSKHYCMGLLKEISLQKERHFCCLVDEPSGCCDFETEQLAVAGDFLVEKGVSLESAALVLISEVPASISIQLIAFESEAQAFPIANAPPGETPSRHILHCSFLI